MIAHDERRIPFDYFFGFSADVISAASRFEASHAPCHRHTRYLSRLERTLFLPAYDDEFRLSDATPIPAICAAPSSRAPRRLLLVSRMTPTERGHALPFESGVNLNYFHR